MSASHGEPGHLPAGVKRRDFLRSAAAVGAGLVAAPTILGAEKAGPAPINVAVIGLGTQGRELVEQARKIPSVNFTAVCDIWSYSKRYASRRLKAYGYSINVYDDYCDMLQKEKDLQAVIVATPDWMHAEHTTACLKAGLHVYCEKEMSNDLAKAREMVVAARETGNLLQIGHQRRSNPRYLHAKHKLLDEAHLLGRITHIYGQWNRSPAACAPKGCPEAYLMDEATLRKYGYANMNQLRDWRFYRKYGGGPIADIGSHQIDIFGWFLDAPPASLVAEGGCDYWKQYEWYDNALAIYRFDTPQGTVRAFYQTLSTTSAVGYFERFMGDQGTLQISESVGKCRVFAEGHLTPKAGESAHPWQTWVEKGYLVEVPKKKEKTKRPTTRAEEMLAVYKSIPPTAFVFNKDVEDSFHLPHLKNFFEAVRGRAELACPAEVGYETAVQVLKVNEAIAGGEKLHFKEEDFTV